MTERVLFLCTHNSARSQMAEGMLRAWAGDRYEAHSAGGEATFVRPEAIQVMSELGIDISAHDEQGGQPLRRARLRRCGDRVRGLERSMPVLPCPARASLELRGSVGRGGHE